jgi:hypothetical protein
MTNNDEVGANSEITPQESKSTAEVEGPASSPRDLQGIVIPASTLASFLIEAARNKLPKKGKRWARPFYIDERLLRVFDRRVRDNMTEVIDGNTASCRILVSYSDLSDESYSTLDDFFSLATEEYDAESVHIIWSGFGQVNGQYHEVSLELMTEQPLATQAIRAPVPEAAGITITVLGATRNWVRTTFNSLSAVIKNTRLSILFRPLENLKNSLFVEIGAFLLAASSFYLVFVWTSRSLQGPSNQAQINHVLSQRTLAEQFAQFIRQIYSTSTSPLIIGLLVFLLPWFAFFLLELLARRYLPYLVPRSAINVGLSGRRYKEYMNLFKFIVFTVIVGIILAVIANLITTVLQK